MDNWSNSDFNENTGKFRRSRGGGHDDDDDDDDDDDEDDEDDDENNNEDGNNDNDDEEEDDDAVAPVMLWPRALSKFSCKNNNENGMCFALKHNLDNILDQRDKLLTKLNKKKKPST